MDAWPCCSVCVCDVDCAASVCDVAAIFSMMTWLSRRWRESVDDADELND
jgi:hypothetical protein